MFIAHVAGGYLLTRAYLRNIDTDSSDYAKLKCYLVFGLLCSVLPDVDLFYFYLIDHRQHPHHTYWTHIPLFWVLFAGFGFFLTKAVRAKSLGVLWTILLLNTQLHMVLDTVAGGIYWLSPFSHIKYRLFTVTSRYDWWVFNYIFHWTFLLELLIIAAAIYVYFQDRKYARVRVATQFDT